RRCLHCDCEGAEDCRLRMFAKELGANPLRFRGEKRGYERDTTHPNLIFESGKCIACGICVRIAAQEKERLGLTFVGRGFALKTRAPFGEDLAVALKESAEACAKACPTGALIWRPSKGNNG
ncbi:MAG: glutamate synthase, partial [Chloroflexi bacterium]|nr:glutamate synthase [Chloroflexota bacterium]